MELTTHEQVELGRCAQAMYSRGRNDLGHALSAASAKITLTTAEYDRVMHVYRQWLVFNATVLLLPNPR